MAHVAASNWQHFFLYDADSLTLPLVKQSLSHGEPFKWIFSSQIFLFPEGILYGLCSLVTASVRSSLLLNAFVNIVLLYILLRLIAGVVLKNTRNRKPSTYALIAILLFLSFQWLERLPEINGLAISTLFDFTTYYYGVSLSGLAVVFLVTTLLTQQRLRTTKVALLSLAIVFITTLTQLSNPLFLLQVTAPITLAIVLIYLFRRIHLLNTVCLISLQAVGLLAAQAVRIPFAPYISSSTDRYVRFDNIHNSLAFFKSIGITAFSRVASSIEYALLGCLIVFAFVRMIDIICQKSVNHVENAKEQTSAKLFVLFVAGPSPFLLLSSMVITGTTTTRYLLPIFIYPLLALFAIKLPHANSVQRFLRIGWLGLLCCVLACGVIAVKPARTLLETNFTDENCLTTALNHRQVNGVASYWTARPLDVYRSQMSPRVLQVIPGLAVYPWLNNLGSYEHKTYNFVLVDHASGPANVSSDNVRPLGSPTAIHPCQNFDVYYYDATTPGYRMLNAIIGQTLTAAEAPKRN